MTFRFVMRIFDGLKHFRFMADFCQKILVRGVAETENLPLVTKNSQIPIGIYFREGLISRIAKLIYREDLISHKLILAKINPREN